MLEVQLCRRSEQGALIPIGRSADPQLARLVAEHITKEMTRLRFGDSLLNEIAEGERRRLREHLAAEGVQQ
ncbi:MAG TPA: hypothetical protein PLJ35_09860 [Anaerolineae bacterium]|nr:hypothetical protein [Anaerolineae bacterium]HOQ99111.1 hypothetical protein [Anaerolineae bacterium]HPL29493.1 hypothetical protein [Anaerolineae bacterium]